MRVLTIVGQLPLLSPSLLWKDCMYPATRGLSYATSVLCFHRPRPWDELFMGWILQSQEPQNVWKHVTQEHPGTAQWVGVLAHRVCWATCEMTLATWQLWNKDLTLTLPVEDTEVKRVWAALKASPSQGSSPQYTVYTPDSDTHSSFTLSFFFFFNELSRSWIDDLLESLPGVHSHFLLWLL